jgi:hypothetical protein
VRSEAPGATVPVADQGGDGGAGGGAGRTRPEFQTPVAKAVLAIWCGVTLVLVAIYAIALVFL